MTNRLILLLVSITVLSGTGSSGAHGSEQGDASVPKTPSGQHDVRTATVQHLIGMLRETSTSSRCEAADELRIRKDKSAIPALKLLLDDELVQCRVLAARAIAGLGEPSGLPVLKDALHGPDRLWALDAARYLAENGDDAGYSLLEDALKSPVALDRSLALRALDHLRGGASYAVLSRAMDDEAETVLAAAFEVSSKKDGADFQALIRRQLFNSNPVRRKLATAALGKSKPKENVPLIIDMLKDGDQSVRSAALFFLRWITGRKTSPMSIRSSEAGAVAQQDWLRWWGENKDKPLPRQDPPDAARVTPMCPELVSGHAVWMSCALHLRSGCAGNGAYGLSVAPVRLRSQANRRNEAVGNELRADRNANSRRGHLTAAVAVSDTWKTGRSHSTRAESAA